MLINLQLEEMCPELCPELCPQLRAEGNQMCIYMVPI